jgi:5-formyltetrahydrofolate cyclo-ligase
VPRPDAGAHEAEEDVVPEFSSPACSMHEASHEYMGINAPPPSADWHEVRSWRKRVRDDLLERRMALAVDTRRALGERARAQLLQAVDLEAYDVLGFCWPIRGEFDLRGIAKQHLASGGQVALPVVVQKSAPMEFWKWNPGVPMQTGIWNIPIPEARVVLMPDIVIAPLVGFDESGFRLGYGGGYFDRTLTAANPRPYAVGLGYADSMLRTICPQPHDIAMDLIVTEQSVRRVAPTAYRDGLFSAYQGELIGESLYRELGNRSMIGDQKTKLHAIADVERQTHCRLKPIAERLGIVVSEARWMRVVEQRVSELASLAWPDFIDKALRDWPPYIARFEALKLLAPAGDADTIQRLVEHEAALVAFARLEHDALGSNASLRELQKFLSECAPGGGSKG